MILQKIKIEVVNGHLNKRVDVRTKIFSLAGKKDCKLKPEVISKKDWNNHKSCYVLLDGEYRIEAVMCKKGRQLYGTAIIQVQSGKINIQDWKGVFCPKFTLLENN